MSIDLPSLVQRIRIERSDLLAAQVDADRFGRSWEQTTSRLSSSSDDAAGSLTTVGDAAGDAIPQQRALADVVGETIDAHTGAAAAARESSIEVGNLDRATTQALPSAANLAEQVTKAKDAAADLAPALGDAADAARDSDTAMDRAGDAIGATGERAREAQVSLADLTAVMIRQREAAARLANEQARLAAAEDALLLIRDDVTVSSQQRAATELAVARAMLRVSQAQDRLNAATNAAGGGYLRVARGIGAVGRGLGAAQRGVLSFGGSLRILAIPAVVEGAGALAGALNGVAAGAVAAVGALGPLVGVVAAYPAAISAGVTAMAALKLGMGGVGETAKVLGDATKTAEEQRAALEALPPAIRPVAQQLAGLKTVVQGLRNASAEGLGPGMSIALERIGTLAPVAERMLRLTGDAIGDVAARGATLFASGPFSTDLGRIGVTNARIVSDMGDAMIAVVDAMRHVLIAGGPFVEFLFDVTRQGAEFAASAAAAGRASGGMAEFFGRTQTVLSSLGRTLADFSVALVNVFGLGADTIGQGFLPALESGAARFREFTESADGVARIRQYFLDAQPALEAVGRLIAAVARGLGEMATSANVAPLIDQITDEFLPALGGLSDTMTGSLLPALVTLATAAANFIGALEFSPIVAVASAMADMTLAASRLVATVPGLGTVVATLLSLRLAAAGLALVGRLTGIIGLATAIGSIGVAGTAGARGLAGFIQGARGAAGASLTAANRVGLFAASLGRLSLRALTGSLRAFGSALRLAGAGAVAVVRPLVTLAAAAGSATTALARGSVAAVASGRAWLVARVATDAAAASTLRAAAAQRTVALGRAITDLGTYARAWVVSRVATDAASASTLRAAVAQRAVQFGSAIADLTSYARAWVIARVATDAASASTIRAAIAQRGLAFGQGIVALGQYAQAWVVSRVAVDAASASTVRAAVAQRALAFGQVIAGLASAAGAWAATTAATVANTVASVANGVAQRTIALGALITSLGSAALAWAGNTAATVANAAATAAAGAAQRALALGSLIGTLAGATAAWLANTAAVVASRVAVVAAAAATGVLTVAQLALNAAMAINPFVLIGVALAALVAGLVYAWHHSETFREVVTGAFNAVRDTVGSAVEFIRNLFNDWGWLLSPISTVYHFRDEILGAFRTAGQFIGRFMDDARRFLGDWGFLLGGPLGVIWRFRDEIGRALDRGVQFFRTLPGRVGDALAGLGDRLVQHGRDTIGGFIRGIEQRARDLPGVLRRWVTDRLPRFVKDALGIRSPSRVFTAIGEEIPAGLALGIENGTPAVERASKAAIDAADLRAVNLRRAARITGGQMPTGLAEGIRRGRPEVDAEARATTAAITAVVDSVDPRQQNAVRASLQFTDAYRDMVSAVEVQNDRATRAARMFGGQVPAEVARGLRDGTGEVGQATEALDRATAVVWASTNSQMDRIREGARTQAVTWSETVAGEVVERTTPVLDTIEAQNRTISAELARNLPVARGSHRIIRDVYGRMSADAASGGERVYTEVRAGFARVASDGFTLDARQGSLLRDQGARLTEEFAFGISRSEVTAQRVAAEAFRRTGDRAGSVALGLAAEAHVWGADVSRQFGVGVQAGAPPVLPAVSTDVERDRALVRNHWAKVAAAQREQIAADGLLAAEQTELAAADAVRRGAQAALEVARTSASPAEVAKTVAEKFGEIDLFGEAKEKAPLSFDDLIGRINAKAAETAGTAAAMRQFIDAGISQPMLEQLLVAEQAAPGTMQGLVDRGLVGSFVTATADPSQRIMTATQQMVEMQTQLGVTNAQAAVTASGAAVSGNLITAMTAYMQEPVNSKAFRDEYLRLVNMPEAEFQALQAGARTGKALLDGINAGLRSPISARAAEHADEVIARANAAAKARAGVRSPSTVWAGFGRFMVAGLARGLDAAAPRAAAAAAAGVEGANAAAVRAVDGLAAAAGAAMPTTAFTAAGDAAGRSFAAGLGGGSALVQASAGDLAAQAVAQARAALDVASGALDPVVVPLTADPLDVQLGAVPEVALNAARLTAEVAVPTAPARVEHPAAAAVRENVTPPPTASSSQAPAAVTGTSKRTEYHFHGGIHQADMSGTLLKARRSAQLAALARGGEEVDPW